MRHTQTMFQMLMYDMLLLSTRVLCLTFFENMKFKIDFVGHILTDLLFERCSISRI